MPVRQTPSHNSLHITLTYTSILRVLLVFVAVYFIYLIRDVLALLFVSIIFASAVDPWVDWLEKFKFPRAVSILLIYLVLLAIFSLVIVLMIPPVTEQIGQIINNLPAYYEKISIGLHSLQSRGLANNSFVSGNESVVSALRAVSLTLAQTTRSVFVTITSIFGGLFSLLVVLVITFYLTVEESALKQTIKIITPPRQRAYLMDLIERIQLKIGLWLRGQLLLSLVIGVMTYIGLTILGLKYALLLALVAGILEVVPYIGPWLSGVPAVLVAFSDSLVKVLLVIGLYILVQQVENHLIVPKLMQKVVGLNPIIVIVAILIGIKIGGVVGGLLGVPVAASVNVYLSDILGEYAHKKTGPKSADGS